MWLRTDRALGFCVLTAVLVEASPAENRLPSSAAKQSSRVPVAVLEGTVKGPGGGPVALAHVVAQPITARSTEGLLSAITDSSGRFRIPLPGTTPLRVRVEAKALAGQILDRVVPGVPLSVTLQKGHSIDGVVLDATALQPLAGVDVRVVSTAGSLTIPSSVHSAAEATTDVKGRFHIEGLRSGQCEVLAAASGYGFGSKRVVVPARPLEILVFPGGWISGRVSGPDGRPIVGAVADAQSEPFLASAGQPGVSDGSGRFQITGLREGIYRLLVRHTDFAPAIVPNVPVDKTAGTRTDLTLGGGATLSGRLLGAAGQPLGGTITVQSAEGRPVPPLISRMLHTEATADGRFRLSRVPSGALIVGVTARGYLAKVIDVQVDSNRSPIEVGDIVLEPGLTIRGRVRDKAGQPIVQAHVEGVEDGSSLLPNASDVSGADSGSDGTFVLTVPKSATYRITATAPGFGAVTTLAEGGTDSVDLILRPAGSISGRVVDEQDRPLDAFLVTARHPQHLAGLRALRAEGEADGHFVLRDAAEGEYVLRVSAPNRLATTVAGVRVSSGTTRDVGRIRLTPGGSIVGTVVDTTGEVVAGAMVKAGISGRETHYFADQTETTGTSGAFELRGLEAGLVEIVVTHPNFATAGISGLEVNPERGPTEVRVVMTKGGRIEGWVRTRGRSGVPFAHVRLSGPGLGSSVLATTQVDGSFIFEHVPAGRIRVTLLGRAGPGALFGLQSIDIDVAEGEGAQVELSQREILVRGRVTRRGQPVPNASIRFQGRAPVMMGSGSALRGMASPGPQYMMATVQDEGSYELLVNEPGQYTVALENPELRQRYSRQVAIPDSDTFTADFELGGATVTGVVVDASTDEPLPHTIVSAAGWNDSDVGTAPTAATRSTGQFTMELDPGDYRLYARAEGYELGDVKITVAADGFEEVRFALNPRMTIRGKVLDSRGHGIGGIPIVARSTDGTHSTPERASTMHDGSFELPGVAGSAYAVFAGSEAAGFDLRTGVAPGSVPVTLSLQPGGRVRLEVLGPQGEAISGVQVLGRTVNGVDVAGLFPFQGVSDESGFVEATLPAGLVNLLLVKNPLSATVSINTAEGGTAARKVTLRP